MTRSTWGREINLADEPGFETSRPNRSLGSAADRMSGVSKKAEAGVILMSIQATRSRHGEEYHIQCGRKGACPLN